MLLPKAAGRLTIVHLLALGLCGAALSGGCAALSAGSLLQKGAMWAGQKAAEKGIKHEYNKYKEQRQAKREARTAEQSRSTSGSSGEGRSTPTPPRSATE